VIDSIEERKNKMEIQSIFLFVCLFVCGKELEEEEEERENQTKLN
jgi:hypothetical protein